MYLTRLNMAVGPFDEFELQAWRQVQAVNVESALLP